MQTTGSILGAVLGFLGWLIDSILVVFYHALWIAVGAAGVWLGGAGFIAPVIALGILALYWTTGWMLWFG
ncbi:MAG: hypothetical protein QM809_08215 [Gordonia sp. (in: high G+C Gram-positive bacteria)]|uniref:hypothetical protein n=1 Tax=Gordonia sp. (in: high G+C Gram-positive bacteria) TaxID=84139 RepID=UPI0039E57CCC